MSDATSRPSASRGRGSGRGGRGGFAGRGGRRTNGDKFDSKADESLDASNDEGDFGELRKQYGDKTSVIREMFPDWSEADVLFALQETDGDQNEAVTRIAEGSISQWGEVSKPKKASRAKAKDQTLAPSHSDAPSTGPRATRGGRAVSEGGRGRGRATERGGRSARGRSPAAAPPTNGARNKENQQLSIPTEESSAWGNEKPKIDASEDKEVVAEQSAPIAAPIIALAETPKAAAPAVKTWASMLRQVAVPKAAPPKPKEAPEPKAPEAVEPESVPEPVEIETEAEPVAAEPETELTPVAEHSIPAAETPLIEPEVALPPSKDELTETNLEQVVDDSQPPPTGTAASTAADSWDPRQTPGSLTATPISAAQQQHFVQRPDASGFAASAAKATAERAVRTPSHHHHQRRVLDQEEAVRMPGNREVDRAAVQFGAFSLNGGEEDIDGDREEPETRAQPPADSPVAHPRTSLPPVTQPSVPEAFPQKPITAAIPPIAAPAAATTPASQGSATAQPAIPNPQQFGRFGQAAQDAAQAPQKPLDPFTQQNTASSQPPFDNFSTQTSQPQQPAGAFSSAPSDYASYYTANPPDRNPYNYYGQQFGQQQGAQGQQEAAASQRPFGGYGSSQADNLSQYPQSGALHNQPRFGGNANDAQNSGNSTPNPVQAQQQQPPTQQPGQQPTQPGQQPGQQQPGQGSQPQSHGQQYPGYNHPYYSNPYYHQYYSGYGQGGFGPYGKGGAMYGQPYGVSPNAPYDHTSSPAGFAQSSLHRESGVGSGLGEYSRGGTSQGASQPGLGGSSFGSVHDSFARGASSFQSQGQSFNSQGQPGAAVADELKPFGESKATSGPSPSIGGARPGSATNAPAAQGGLPPPQNSQMGGYGGYPSHLQGHGLHGSNAYGMGGNAGASQHANSPYGSYGQGFGGSGGYYGGNQQQQQQQQQQRGGWGGNYH
ncbi:hypothetical protein AK830_g2674 [Neonectria ditissima]|uniref:RNA polymerase II degradation factor 1 n=1 Tax=Neonectria ditissima TaxID=78410 RepID=A0A0N8H884_9HYPO|nr:hypothetical protein AK830_g2674 [Neonectria ditissima]